jgi:hypothetical protein
MFRGSTGLKHNIRHTTAITSLSPHLRDVRRAGCNWGGYRRQRRPHQGETCKVRRLHTPAMLALTHLSHHVTQHPNPQQQATATGPRYHDTQHTTHQASAAGPGTQHTARLPPRPQTRRVTQRGCLFNVPRRGQVTPVPPAPARPTPRRASHDGSPHPCTSQAHPMQVPTVPHAQSCVMQPRRDSRPTTQGSDTATPRCPPPDSAAEPPDAVAPPRSYCPLPTLPTHRQRFAGDVGAQVRHRSSGVWEFGRRGHLYHSCRRCHLAPPAPTRARIIYIIYN